MFRKIIRGSVKSQSETMAPRAPISPVAFAAPVPYMLVPAGQTNALDTKPQATVPAASFLAAAEVTGLGTVGTTAALNTAILAADNQTTAGTYEIDLSSNITLSAALEAINLHSGVSLVINGQGNTLDGGGTQRGLFVYSGNVTVEDLTIASAKALGGAGGNSGTGNSGGGGGAGLGGGLFVAAAGTVTVQNVSFSADSAQGGQGGQSLHITGGAGGGGGLGGNGGSANLGSTYGDGGGGGIGVGAAGGNIAGGNGSAGIIPGTAAGGSGLSTGAGGASGGGGGGGIFEGGAGGGIGGGANAGFEGGVGGFGGGGGGAYYNQPGAAGGFGGGGGGNYHTGGAGGFGGGGGGNYGGTVHVSNAPGGFGAGNGNSNGGGGGLGAGGDIFVQQGGTLLIEGGTLGAGTVTGGTGPSSNSGSAYGSSIFLQGDESLTLASAAGTTTTISGAIADQAGSGGTGAGTLLIGGSTATGTVVLAAANNFTGGLILGGGTLELAHTGAAGSGTIGFANGQSAALKLDLGDVPANILASFSVRDAIDFAGIGTATAATLDSGDTLTISGGSSTATLHLTGNYTGDHFGVFSDGAGGTVLGLSVPSPTSLALALASISGTVGTATDIATPSITGNGSSGDTISLYDGTLVVGSTVETSTTWSVQTSSLAVGTHTLTATQTDLNGNISPASAAFGLTIVAPPATPANLSLDQASRTSTLATTTDITAPSIDGTGTVGDTIKLYDGTLLVGSTVATGTAWSVQTSSLAVGTHTLTATQTDPYGDVSAASAALSLTIVSPPAAAANLSLDRTSQSGTIATATDITTPSIDGTGTVGDTIKLYDGTLLVGSTVATSTAWSVQTSSLAAGTHTLTATQTDSYGDVSAASTALSLTIVSPPAAPTNLSLDHASQSGTLATATDITTPSIDGIGTVGDTIKLYDGTLLVGSTVATSTAWSVQTSSLAVGTHTLTATQTDSYGDVSAASAALGLTIVAVPDAPTTPTLDPGSISGTLADTTDITTPSIDGTGTIGDTISLFDGTLLVGSIVATSTAWSVQTSSLSVGTHMLTATETDPYGNVSVASAALALTIVAPPNSPTDLLLAPASDSGVLGDDITNVTSPSIQGSGTAGDTIWLYDGSSLVGTTAVAQDGAWSVTAGPLADGVHSLTAKESSPSGDVSAASAPLVVTIDSVLPEAPTLAETVRTTNPAEPILDGAATSGDVVTIFQDGTAIGTTTAASGTWQFAYTGVLDTGAYALSATATDVAGNVSAQSAPLKIVVAADMSYSVVAPIAGTDTNQVNIYNSAGTLSTVQVQTPQGRVLTSVTEGQALLNIYDIAGTLVGTITQPTTAAFATPVYTTTPLTEGASTDGGTLDSMVDLLSEQNRFVSHGNADITAHAGSATIFGLGASTIVNDIDANVTFYGGTGQASVYGGSGQLVAIGGSGGGALVGGTGGDNVLVAGGGTTTLVGVADGDTLFGSAQGTDTEFAGAGHEILVGGGGTDTMVAGDGTDAFGAAGTTTMFAGNNGGSTLVGGSGATVMVAGGGTANMWAGSGITTMWAGSGTDVMGGNAAITSDTIMVGGTGNDIFVGGSGTITAYSGTGHDTFFTAAGTMTIFGGTGPDTIAFGSGSAVVHGGTGADTYVLTAGYGGGTEMIYDFKVGVDQLDMFGYAPNDMQESLGASGLTMSFSDGTNILLVGVTQLAVNSLK